MAYLENMNLANWRRKSLVLFKIVLIGALLLVSSCSNVKPVTVQPVKKIPLPKINPALTDPSPITTQEITWVVISPLTQLKDNEVFIALTPKEYEELSKNMAEITRWVKEAKWRLDYYRQTLSKEAQ